MNNLIENFENFESPVYEYWTEVLKTSTASIASRVSSGVGDVKTIEIEIIVKGSEDYVKSLQKKLLRLIQKNV